MASLLITDNKDTLKLGNKIMFPSRAVNPTRHWRVSCKTKTERGEEKLQVNNLPPTSQLPPNT